MTKAELRRRLDRAIETSRRTGQQVLGFPLPNEVRFDFGDLGRYQNEKPVPEGKVKILGGRLLRPEEIKNLDTAMLATYLYVDGKVPVWINLHGMKSDGKIYLVEVVTSDHLTVDESTFYHKHEGNPPFHILFPAYPLRGTFLKAE